jgi:hypothetical protein
MQTLVASSWFTGARRGPSMYTAQNLSDHGSMTTIIGSPLGVNRVEASSRRGLRSCGVAAASLGDPSAETLAFLSRQPRPAVRRKAKRNTAEMVKFKQAFGEQIMRGINEKERAVLLDVIKRVQGNFRSYRAADQPDNEIVEWKTGSRPPLHKVRRRNRP